MEKSKKTAEEIQHKMQAAIGVACDSQFGVLDAGFLCESVSVLNPKPAICIKQDISVQEVIALFQTKRIGAVIVVDQEEKLCGIFTERDLVQKVLSDTQNHLSKPVSTFMTREPVAQPPDCTIAYALNLMSFGGFRHIPLIDDAMHPIGMISVRDVVDYISSSMVEDLLEFKVSSPS